MRMDSDLCRNQEDMFIAIQLIVVYILNRQGDNFVTQCIFNLIGLLRIENY